MNYANGFRNEDDEVAEKLAAKKKGKEKEEKEEEEEEEEVEEEEVQTKSPKRAKKGRKTEKPEREEVDEKKPKKFATHHKDYVARHAGFFADHVKLPAGDVVNDYMGYTPNGDEYFKNALTSCGYYGCLDDVWQNEFRVGM